MVKQRIVLPPCSRCHSTSEYLFRTRDYNRRRSSRSFNYFRCKSCHLIFISPTPENVEVYYGNEYYEIPEDLAQLTQLSEGNRYKLDIVKSVMTGGRLLEIGSAYGGFAHLAQQAGFEVTCIEMDEDCCTFLKDKLGIRAIRSSEPTETLKSLGNFDVIVLWHVIEHVEELWALLNSLVQHLSQDGILITATPNPDSVQFKVFQGRWAHLDAPRHLQLIPLELLKNQMADSGMELVNYMTSDKGGVGWNTFGWRRSFANYCKGPFGEILSLFGKLISVLVSPIERMNFNGSTYTAIFRK